VVVVLVLVVLVAVVLVAVVLVVDVPVLDVLVVVVLTLGALALAGFAFLWLDVAATINAITTHPAARAVIHLRLLDQLRQFTMRAAYPDGGPKLWSHPSPAARTAAFGDPALRSSSAGWAAARLIASTFGWVSRSRRSQVSMRSFMSSRSAPTFSTARAIAMTTECGIVVVASPPVYGPQTCSAWATRQRIKITGQC